MKFEQVAIAISNHNTMISYVKYRAGGKHLALVRQNRFIVTISTLNPKHS